MDEAEAGVRKWMQEHSDVDSSFRVMGKSPLEFAIATYNEDLAMDILNSCTIQCIKNQIKSDNSSNYSCLHLAVQGGLTSIIPHLSQPEFNLLDSKTLDMKLPFDMCNVEPGGKTPLHLAVQLNEFQIVQALIKAGASIYAKDLDGNTPYDVSIMYKRPDRMQQLLLAEHVTIHGDSEWYQKKVLQDKSRALSRYNESLIPKFTKRIRILSLFSLDECRKTLEAVEAYVETEGRWSTNRHQAFATTDIPSSNIVQLDAWIRSTLEVRLFPKIQSEYEVSDLSFRDLFFVKYTVGHQCELPLHKDGSELSFNVLLNPKEEFLGGGTYFDKDNVVEHLENAGDALVHPGKERHAGNLVTRGVRYILVGFLNV